MAILSKKVEYFMSVVETGSFSASAKVLYLSQSAISQQISQLEKELGIKLFSREGYKPKLTEAGQYYYEASKVLILKYESIIEESKKIEALKAYKLRIGITGPIEEKHLPLIINKFKHLFPEINIVIRKGNFTQGVAFLNQHKIDIAFGIANEFEGIPTLEIAKLFNHKVCMICSPEHPFANRKAVSGKEIGNEPIISFSKKFGDHFYNAFIHAFKEDGVEPNIVKEVDNLDELMISVRINEGIGFISKEVIGDLEGLHVVALEKTHHHAEFCVAYLKSNTSPLLEKFIEVSKDYFGKEYR